MKSEIQQLKGVIKGLKGIKRDTLKNSKSLSKSTKQYIERIDLEISRVQRELGSVISSTVKISSRNETTSSARKRALKAWKTIRANRAMLSNAGKKAWATRRKNVA